MTTNEIADVIINNLSSRSFPIFLTTFSSCGFDEADVLGINNIGYIYEFEIKRSRNDFLAEFKNKNYKHKKLKEKSATKTYNIYVKGKRTDDTITHIIIPNRYYFACEKHLISLREIPEYCGLIYIDNKKPVEEKYMEIKSAPLLHRNKANEIIYKRIANILSQRIIFGCSYYTHRHKK